MRRWRTVMLVVLGLLLGLALGPRVVRWLGPDRLAQGRAARLW